MKAIGYLDNRSDAGSGSLVDLDLPQPVATGRDLLVEVKAVSVNPVDTKVLKDQLGAVFDQGDFDAIKIGLMATNELAYQIYRILSTKAHCPIVIDPVMRSSSGSVLRRISSTAVTVAIRMTAITASTARVMSIACIVAQQAAPW